MRALWLTSDEQYRHGVVRAFCLRPTASDDLTLEPLYVVVFVSYALECSLCVGLIRGVEGPDLVVLCVMWGWRI